MSGNFGFSVKIKYYVFEKDNFHIAIPYYSNGMEISDNLNVFNFIIEQGFNYFDVDINFVPRSIYANNPTEAIEEAKKISEREINKLKAEINRLHSEKEFSFKKGDEYAVFGVSDNTPRDDVKKIYTAMSKFLHPDNGTEKSEYLTKIINQAWDIIKRRK